MRNYEPPHQTTQTTREMIELYERLGIEWSSFELGYNDGKKTMNGAWNKQRKNMKADNGLHIYIQDSNIEVIDLDADTEHTQHIMKLAQHTCNLMVRTRKGYHLYFRGNNNFQSKINTELHIDLFSTDKRAIMIASPSIYTIPAEPKDERIYYNMIAYPTDKNDINPMPDTLIDYLKSLGFTARVPVKKIETESTPTPDPEMESPPLPPALDDIGLLCECLTSAWLSDTSNWLKLAYCLKTLGDDATMLELFLNTSSRAPGYNTARARDSNEKKWRELRPNNRLTIGSLKHWAKVCDPIKYFNQARRDYLRLLTSSPGGPSSTALCELFINEMAGDIMFSTSDKDFYVYDPGLTLWKGGKGVRAIINSIFADTCQRAIIKIIEGLPAGSEKSLEQRKRLIKTLDDVDGRNAVNLVNDFLPAICIPPVDPLTYFDQNPDLLPLENGVWKFSESKLIPYERDHYFTHKISIKYNPNADTSLIRRAMNDWFKGDEDTISYLQHIIGYCLTGYTSKQIFGVAWGSEAGNGKSLLWGEIVPSLLGKKYSRRVTSDAFTDMNSINNDELYYLNGARYAFMSEPRKGKKTGAMDNELWKTLTGDKEFTAQAKYKNALTFHLMVKIICACNDLPDFNCDDKGMMRRFVPFKQNVACLDKEDYDNAPANLKAARDVILKDDEFCKALLADTEGTMKWALMGATDFMANPRREPPAAIKATKNAARTDIDTLTAWLSGNIEPGTKNLSFSSLKAEWRAKGLNFEQTKKGFAGRLTNKIKMLGFTVDEGRAGKSEERILKCQLVPDKVDGLIDD